MTFKRAILTDSLIYLAIAWLACASGVASAQHCQVHVDGDGSLGSGTLIDTDADAGLVITCGHMVRDSKAGIWVSFPGDQRRYSARIVAEDQRNDLCALVIGLPAAKPIKVSPSAPSGMLTACGFGGNQGFRPVTGPIVGQTQPQGATAPSLIIRGAVRPGDSGGGVLDSNGMLVGVVWGTRDGETYLTAGEPLHVLLTQCCANGQCYSGGQQSYRVVTQPVQSQPVQTAQSQGDAFADPRWVQWRNDMEELAKSGKCECGDNNYVTHEEFDDFRGKMLDAANKSIEFSNSAKAQLTVLDATVKSTPTTITNALTQNFEQRFVKIEQKLDQPETVKEVAPVGPGQLYLRAVPLE